jgi:hypothetical protein
MARRVIENMLSIPQFIGLGRLHLDHSLMRQATPSLSKQEHQGVLGVITRPHRLALLMIFIGLQCGQYHLPLGER